MQNFIIRITQENTNLISNQELKCFILSANISPEYAKYFIDTARDLGKIVLCENINLYSELGADGIIIDTSKENKPQKIIKNIQQQMNPNILGIICRNRRHEAMLISECEPDFIIFKCWNDGLPKTLELLNWYTELFLIQCAAQIEENIDLSKLPTDFIILDDVKYSALL